MIVAMKPKEPKANFPRDLEEDFNQFFRSIYEVHKVVGDLVSLAASNENIRFKERVKPKRAQVINAVLLYVSSLSEDEREDILQKGIHMLNELLRIPKKGAKINPAERDGEIGGVTFGDPESPKPKKRRAGGTR